MRLSYEEQAHWPPLAWLATVRSGTPLVHVRHGREVETRPEWFCEAVWAGDFSSGDFDATDIVFGSGARIRDGKLLFVSSGSTLDRLHWLRKGGQTFVSNSLPCLVAAAGAELDPAGARYLEFFLSVIDGLGRYHDALPTSAGELRLCYFHNLAWTGDDLVRVQKPCGERTFADFDALERFLHRSLAGIAANMAARARKRRYRFMGTLSEGYDSTAATALASRHGLAEAICFEQPGPNREDGAGIARHLGVEPLVFGLDEWRDLSHPEVPFIAGDGFGEEVHFAAAHDRLGGRVLVTGHYGDKIWGKHNPNPNPDIVRGDLAGLAQTEFRLHAGFIHLPAPFLGVRAAADIHRISNGAELAPWDVGGAYTRPLARRIVEAAGVPREAFGRKKRFACRWLLVSRRFLTERSRADYCEWLAERRGRWWRRGRVPPIRSERYDRAAITVLNRAGALLISMPGFFELGLDRVHWLRRIALARAADSKIVPATTGFRRSVVPWAIERATRAYAPAPAPAGAKARPERGHCMQAQALTR